MLLIKAGFYRGRIFHYQLLKRIYTIVGIELFRKIELNDCHKEQGVTLCFFIKIFLIQIIQINCAGSNEKKGGVIMKKFLTRKNKDSPNL